MEYIVPGICGLLLLIGFVGIGLSHRVWRIPQVILVGLILISSTVFFWMAARTLQTHAYWQQLVNDYKKQIELAEKGNIQGQQVIEKGIEQLRQENICLNRALSVALAFRGRVWHDVGRGGFDQASLMLTAKLDDSSPGRIEPKSILYVFEEADKEKGGKYLGEFVVANAKDTRIELAPATSLLESEIRQISDSRGPWAFYEVMPADDHQALVLKPPAGTAQDYCDQVANPDPGLDANQLKALLPTNPNDPKDPKIEALREEYARDGTPAKASDPADHVWLRVKFLKAWGGDEAAAPPAGVEAAGARSFLPGDTRLFAQPMAQELIDKGFAKLDADAPDGGKVYVRPLRDYAHLFRAAHRDRDRLFTETAELTAQATNVENSTASVKADIKLAQVEHDNLKFDMDHIQPQLKAVTDYATAVGARLAQIQALAVQTLRSNFALAAELDKLEHEAYDAISRRHPQGQANAEARPAPLP